MLLFWNWKPNAKLTLTNSMYTLLVEFVKKISLAYKYDDETFKIFCPMKDPCKKLCEVVDKLLYNTQNFC